MKISRFLGLTLLGCALLALPAAAIPNIQPCSSYVLYASGTIPYATIAFENSPHGVTAATATTSGTGRCYSLWSSALAFANAGCQTTVQDLGNGSYQYYCWKCAGAIGPVKVFPGFDAAHAIARAVDAVPGQVLNVRHHEVDVDERATVGVYDVDIVQGDAILRVRVNAETGEVTAPQPLDR
ncbi:MAG TPA: PepSY domain-containing protein [Thermoanaerobaculia bacterium]|nr:PepSY domain-containing protein [Thermoanaerobaculia bacterium]